jgi:hypothetical protein
MAQSALRMEVHKVSGTPDHAINCHLDRDIIFPGYTHNVPMVIGTVAVTASPEIRLRYFAAWTVAP